MNWLLARLASSASSLARCSSSSNALALGDVGMGADPFDDVAVVGEHGCAAGQHVAPLAVIAAHAILRGIRNPLANRLLPRRDRRVTVVRMDRVEPAEAGDLLDRLPGELPPPIDVAQQDAGGVGPPDDLRGRLHQRAIAPLLGAQLLLLLPRLGHVGIGADPAPDRPIRVPHRLGARQEPAPHAVVPAQRERVLPLLARLEAMGEPGHDPVDLRRVVHPLPAPALHLVEVEAGVLHPALVIPVDRPVRGGEPAELRQLVGERHEVVEVGLSSHGEERIRNRVKLLRGSRAPVARRAPVLDGPQC